MNDSEESIADIKSRIEPLYKKVKYLATGASGMVFKTTTFADKTIAVKIRRNAEYEIAKLEILKDGCEANLVSCYYGSYKLDNDMYVIEMEYIDGWTVDQFIKINGKSLDHVYYLLLLITIDVMRALRYIHSKGIIHNDLHIENILINKKTYVPKVIDFSEAAYIGKHDTETSVIDLEFYRKSLGGDINLYEWWPKDGTSVLDIPNGKLFDALLNGMDRFTPDQIIRIIEENIIKPT